MKIGTINDLIKYHEEQRDYVLKRCRDKNDDDIQEFFEERLETHSQALEVLIRQVRS